MIQAILILLAISGVIFIALSKKSLNKRLIWSLLFFVVSACGFIALILIIGDPPPKDAVPITKEVMEKEGMTNKEWDEYVQKQQKSK